MEKSVLTKIEQYVASEYIVTILDGNITTKYTINKQDFDFFVYEFKDFDQYLDFGIGDFLRNTAIKFAIKKYFDIKCPFYIIQSPCYVYNIWLKVGIFYKKINVVL